MPFVIGLLIAVLFAALLAPALRRAPLPFYLAALLLTAAAVLAGEADPESELLTDWVLPLFTKGSLAAAF